MRDIIAVSLSISNSSQGTTYALTEHTYDPSKPYALLSNGEEVMTALAYIAARVEIDD